MSTLEKRVACLEQGNGAVPTVVSVVRFVCPTRGLVGLRCGDFTMSRLDDETEVHFLVRAREELLNVAP